MNVDFSIMDRFVKVKVDPVIKTSHFHGVEEQDEGFSEEVQKDINIFAEDSVVAIGNKVDFYGGVVILPDGDKQTFTTAEHIFNGIRTGQLKAKNIGKEFVGKDRCCCLTKTGFLFMSVLGLIVTIVVMVTLYSSPKIECSDFVSRAMWKAAPPTCALTPYQKVPNLVLVYQTEQDVCKLCETCIEQVRSLQSYQQNPRSARVRPSPACDIQYNFLVGSDGRIYEGRGFKYQSGMPDTFEDQTLILAFMGLFVAIHPLDNQLQAAEKFLEKAAADGHLDPDFKLAGAIQVCKSDNPGCMLQGELRLWRRWTDKPLELLNTTRTRNETYADLCN